MLTSDLAQCVETLVLRSEAMERENRRLKLRVNRLVRRLRELKGRGGRGVGEKTG